MCRNNSWSVPTRFSMKMPNSRRQGQSRPRIVPASVLACPPKLIETLPQATSGRNPRSGFGHPLIAAGKPAGSAFAQLTEVIVVRHFTKNDRARQLR